MNYGSIHIHLVDILDEKKISKNQICKDLDIPRTNFNRYCRGDFQRIDANLLCKICYYLECEISDILEYRKPK